MVELRERIPGGAGQFAASRPYPLERAENELKRGRKFSSHASTM